MTQSDEDRSTNSNTPAAAENPYESPRTEPSPAQRTVRRLGVWLAAPLSLFAAVIAFCVTCYPVAQVGIAAAGFEGASPNYLGAFLIAIPSFLLGIVVAVLAARTIWRMR